jgi:hypothetical protein
LVKQKGIHGNHGHTFQRYVIKSLWIMDTYIASNISQAT